MNRKIFLEYAVEKKCTAIGFAILGDLIQYKNKDDLQNALERNDFAKRQAKDIMLFRDEIKPLDIILQYDRGKVYVGKAESSYYFVKESEGTGLDFFWQFDKINRAPNRIDVNWGFNKSFLNNNNEPRLLRADFPWNDTVHEITAEELDFKKGNMKREINEDLRLFLKSILPC